MAKKSNNKTNKTNKTAAKNKPKETPVKSSSPSDVKSDETNSVESIEERQSKKVEALNKRIKETLKDSKTPISTQIREHIHQKISAKDIAAICIIGNVVQISMAPMGDLITNLVHLFCEMDAMKHKPCALRHWTKVFHHRFHTWKEAMVMVRAHLLSLEKEEEIQAVVEDFEATSLKDDDEVCELFYDAVKRVRRQIA